MLAIASVMCYSDSVYRCQTMRRPSPMPSETSEQLEKRRSELKERLVELGDMRPGSLVERYRRCGKPACHCASRNATGHGPSWSLTRGVAGKTVTKIIPPTAVEQTRRQFDDYHAFRLLIGGLVKFTEADCEARRRG